MGNGPLLYWTLRFLPCKTLRLLISYADGCLFLYEVTDQNREILIDDINDDLQKLEEWRVIWHASFAPDKTHSLLVSR